MLVEHLQLQSLPERFQAHQPLGFIEVAERLAVHLDGADLAAVRVSQAKHDPARGLACGRMDHRSYIALCDVRLQVITHRAEAGPGVADAQRLAALEPVASDKW